jgi:hypothetical protein
MCRHNLASKKAIFMSDNDTELQPTIGRAVLGRGNARRKVVYIEEWGGNVLVRQISGRQYAALKQLAGEAIDTGKQQVRDRNKLSMFNFALIRDSWINEDGTPVLTDADYDMLVDEPTAVIEKLTSEISEFNGMGDNAQRDAKKNSALTLNGASGISSR